MWRFAEPGWFFALAGLALLGLVAAVFARAGHFVRPRLLFSRLEAARRVGRSWRLVLARGLWIPRVLALVAIITALARPQLGRGETFVSSEGIDIMLLIDTSASMAAEDFGRRETRLDHVTDVIRGFVERRPADRVGVVSFGAAAYTRCPLTLDHALVDEVLDFTRDAWRRAYLSFSRKGATSRGQAPTDLTPEEEDLQGTAIGDGLVAAVSRLENSEAKSKVVVLLSDGENTAGEVAPRDAAELAREFGVRVYTVGAGSDDRAPVLTFDRFGREVRRLVSFRLDEKTLTDVAEATGGRYFHAGSRDRLEEVYAEIDRLERAEITSRDFREWDERFPPLVWCALGLLLLELLLRCTVARRLP
ncbi:MAG: VWA domain-containing protein [Planctomycetota bacterium]